MISALMFAVIPLYFYHTVFKDYPDAQVTELIVITLYAIGVAICFLFSAMQVRT
jgi:adiponectin receptor